MELSDNLNLMRQNDEIETEKVWANLAEKKGGHFCVKKGSRKNITKYYQILDGVNMKLIIKLNLCGSKCPY